MQESDFPKIAEIVENASENESLYTAREDAKAATWMYESDADTQVVDFMMQNMKKFWRQIRIVYNRKVRDAYLLKSHRKFTCDTGYFFIK